MQETERNAESLDDLLIKMRRQGLTQKRIAEIVGKSLKYVQQRLRGIPAILPEKECSNPTCRKVFRPGRDAWQRYCQRSCYMDHKRRQFS